MKNDTFFKEVKQFTFSKVKIQAILINIVCLLSFGLHAVLWLTCWCLWTSNGVMIYKMWPMTKEYSSTKEYLYWSDVLMYLFLSPVLEWILAFSSPDNKFCLPWSMAQTIKLYFLLATEMFKNYLQFSACCKFSVIVQNRRNNKDLQKDV